MVPSRTPPSSCHAAKPNSVDLPRRPQLHCLATSALTGQSLVAQLNPIAVAVQEGAKAQSGAPSRGARPAAQHHVACLGEDAALVVGRRRPGPNGFHGRGEGHAAHHNRIVDRQHYRGVFGGPQARLASRRYGAQYDSGLRGFSGRRWFGRHMRQCSPRRWRRRWILPVRRFLAGEPLLDKIYLM
jgi:hypothetical protein